MTDHKESSFLILNQPCAHFTAKCGDVFINLVTAVDVRPVSCLIRNHACSFPSNTCAVNGKRKELLAFRLPRDI